MKESADVRPEENRQFEKRLARGLEDVSYLFLSQPPKTPAEHTAGQTTPQAPIPAQSAPPLIPILLHSSAAVNRELLISVLSKNASALEEGMHAIDANIPCAPFGSIDLLALDRLNQLSVVNVDAVQNDTLLLCGIGCVDWLVRHTPIVRRMYPGRVIDYGAPPRLFLVAPGFSSLLQCAAKRSANPKVTCFEYRAATIANAVGILFARA